MNPEEEKSELADFKSITYSAAFHLAQYQLIAEGFNDGQICNMFPVIEERAKKIMDMNKKKDLRIENVQ